MNRALVRTCVLVSLALHVLDQATDAFVGCLFFFEGHVFSAILTWILIFTPGLFIFVCEIKKICSTGSNIFKALAYFIFSPVWSIIIHLYSFFDERYIQSALYFKTLEGFLEAAPQLVLQLSLLFRGSWALSSKMVLGSLIQHPDLQDGGNISSNASQDIEIFGRVYDEDSRHFFGSLHIVSVVLSFLSVFLTTISFNDLESSNFSGNISDQIVCTKQMMGKIFVSIPFIFFTLVFRSIGLATIICFARYWGGTVIFILFFINVLSALSIGDSIGRSFSYGLWSLLVPVGFNRDPSAPLGYSKIPLFLAISEEVSASRRGVHFSASDEIAGLPEDLGAPSDESLSFRSKYFLTAHVLSSCIVLAPCVLATLVVVQILQGHGILDTEFDFTYLNNAALPVLGLSLGFSLFLSRPYHRCECSGGEAPKGNLIV